MNNYLLFVYFFLLYAVWTEARSAPSWKDCSIGEFQGNVNKVKMVDCRGRRWKTVPKDVFDFKGARYIRLENNPYVCDCKGMEWFINALGKRANKMKIFAYSDITCNAPKEYEGVSVYYGISSGDLCPKKTKKRKKATSWKDCEQYDYASLNQIDCSNREIRDIPKDLFTTHVKTIMLGPNPYDCSCNMRWFTKKLRLRDFSQLLLNGGAKCASPPRLKGTRINKLTEEDVCPHLEDVDECKENLHDCDKNARCVNKKKVSKNKKGFLCICKPGYTGSGTVCNDINECLSVKCPDNSKCHNQLGSYDCVCDKGYSKNGAKCSDIDECLDKTTDCSKDAVCHNTVGSYECVCKEGFISHHNGKVCEKKEVRTCQSKPSPCSDLHEVCVDDETLGTFKCHCEQGFERTSKLNGKCQDVDECEPKSPCPAHAQCKNTVGSYKCSCNHGFVHKRKRCLDIDECSTGKHNCHRDAICINSIGGYKCHCKAGFEEHKNGRLCVKKDIIVDVPVSSTELDLLSSPKKLLLIVMAVIAAVVVACMILIIRRKKKRKNTSGIAQKPQTKTHRPYKQTFFFNNTVPPSESTFTQWSEDECEDDTDSDFDSD